MKKETYNFELYIRELNILIDFLINEMGFPFKYHQKQNKWYPPKVFTCPFRSYTRFEMGK